MKNSQNLVRSAVFGQLPILVQFISGFVIMPRLILYFGARYYGLWVLTGACLGYFGLLDFGFSKTIVRYVSRALGTGDKEAGDGWITMGLVLFSLSAVLGFVVLEFVLLGCRFFITSDLEQIRNVLMLGSGAFLVVLPTRCAIGVLQAHVRGDVLDGIISAVGLLRIVALLIALYMQVAFIWFVGILSLTTILEGAVMVVCAYRIHGSFHLRWHWLTREHIKQFVDYSGFAFIAQLADLFRFQAYPLIISGFLGLAAITPFAIANRLRLLLSQVHNKVLINLTSVFSQIEGRNGIEDELRRAYLFAYKIACYFVTFTCGLMVIVAPQFILRWMGPSHEQAVVLLFVSMIAALAAGMQIPGVCFLFGTSQHRFYSISNSIEAVLIIVSALVLVRAYGLLGMVTGASVSTFIVKMFIQPFWVARMLNMSLWSLHMRHTCPHFIKIALFLGVAYWCSTVFLRPTYLNIGIFSMLTSLLFALYIWIIGFVHDERIRILDSILGPAQFQTLRRFLRWGHVSEKRGEQ